MFNSGRKKGVDEAFSWLDMDSMLGRPKPAPKPPSIGKTMDQLMAEKRIAKASQSSMSGITADALKGVTLRKVASTSVPQSSGVNLMREDSHSGADFADFVSRTRRDLTTLASTKSGQDMFGTISAVHDQNSQLGINIHDASVTGKVQQNSRVNFAQSQLQGSETDLMRFPGSGSSGKIQHHTGKTVWGLPDVGMSSSIALGHEMIHATRGMLGQQEAPGLKEEKATVGPISGSRTSEKFPTENSLRKDLRQQYYTGGSIVSGVPSRTKYGGHKI